ncbi:hypothetical protein EWB00_005262 [Schistosoma japonicum]|uniref:Uncharacterized protein n=1 Tax=Schistosoma japonicum TaxID=6182 RepID=A0A4Z2D2A5_SCHJA|nr:hypothetical protein EWB00_005262 [Schistosoma japonicum]
MNKESVFKEISMISKSLPSRIQYFNSRFDFENLPYSEPKLSPNYRLMIDKRFMPNSCINDAKEYENAWINFAIGAGCYAYKTIGENFKRQFKILLANSAISAVLSGFLAENDTCQEVINCKCNSLCDKDSPVQENIYQPDNNFECNHDGEWFYGLWTMQNSASACDMNSVINQEIIDFCAKLMITTMESYYYTNRFYSSDTIRIILRTTNYQNIIRYGIDDENSLEQKHTGCTSELIPVNVLGNRRLCLTRDIWIRFCEPPVGLKRTHLDYLIAKKLVQNTCIIFFEDYDLLLQLIKCYLKVCSDPYNYHVDKKYLTGSSTPTEVDDGCGLLGRLITFLKYAEPDSNLFSISYLKYENVTCEAYYDDYSVKWETLMKEFHNLNSEASIKEFLKEFLTRGCFDVDCEKLIDCWREYNVEEQIQSRISEYFKYSKKIYDKFQKLMN